jgi:hypothetical protein
MPGVTGEVVVAYRRDRWLLHIGDSLTIGRSHLCAVQLLDTGISRRACLLRVDTGFIMVFNESAQKPLIIRPPVGEDRRVEPFAAAMSLPHTRFEVVFAGHDGRPVSVDVDARRLTLPQPPAVDPLEEPTLGGRELGLIGRVIPNLAGPRDARMQAALLTRTQRAALIALCEPMLTRNGPDARPRTSSELAERLGWKPDYARNVIKEVRHRLSGNGIPGLVSPDGPASGQADLRLALARWAIEWGAVTVADLHDLPANVGGYR